MRRLICLLTAFAVAVQATGIAFASVVDERGKSVSFTYDAAGQMTDAYNQKNEHEEIEYTDRGWVWKVTNGRGKVRTYTYTDRGDLYYYSLPVVSINTEGEIWSHDGNGNATAHGYFKAGLASGSETKSYTYDAANRLTLVNYNTGSMTNVSFDYDDADRKVEMIDGTGTTEWEYTDGDLTKMISPQGTIEYDYDGNARLEYLTEVIPGGSDIVTTYVYDDAGRTSTIDKFGETTTFVYDDASRPEKMIYDTGAYAKYSYDGRSRITAVEHFDSSDFLLRKETNVYDAASRITSRYEGPAAGGVTTTFGYDDVGQLTSESSTGYSASYTYDANGNRATRTVNGVTETYTVDNADKLTSVTWSNGIVNYSKEYAYHYSGRPTSITYKTNGVTQATETMTWDKESRMLTNSLANASFVYNGFDTRVSKTVGSNTTTFKRLGSTAISSLVSETTSGVTTNYLPEISSRAGTASRFHHGGIKNDILQTDSSQANTATKRYDGFGNEISTTGTWQSQLDYGGQFGYQRDDSSGYSLLGHRYYDSSVGRFLTRDPRNVGRNWYSYCSNNPITDADPSGLMSINSPAGAAALAGVADAFGMGVEAGIAFASREFFRYMLRLFGIALVGTLTMTIGDHGRVKYKFVSRGHGENIYGPRGKWRPSWAEISPAVDPLFQEHHGMVKGDNPMTHYTNGFVRKDEEGKTWFRRPAQDYEGNPLNNGFFEIWIPNPQQTVKFPHTYPMPKSLD